MRLVFVFFTLTIVILMSQYSMAETVGQKTGKAIDNSVEATKEAKEKVQTDLEDGLKTTKAKIAELKEKTKTASANVKKDLNWQIENLEKDQKSLEKNLSQLKKSSGKAWDRLKEGAGEALQKLKESYEKAKDEFNKQSDS